ncbi:MAG: YqhA family protein [Planctomycetota bacterium]
MLNRILEFSRYLLVLPVVGSLLLTVAVVVMGLGLILTRGWQLLQNPKFDDKMGKVLSVAVIQAIDLFLVGALGYITAVGIYKLFISQKEEQLLKRIKIEKLADLENKIIGVVVAALAVAFLGDAVEAADAETVLYSGAGSALVIGSLCLFIKFSSAGEG